MRFSWHVAGFLLLCTILIGCGGTDDGAPPPADVDRGAPGTAGDPSPLSPPPPGQPSPEPSGSPGTADVPSADGATGATVEFSGQLATAGTEGLRLVNLRTAEGTVIGLTGPLLGELENLSGAVVTVRGMEASVAGAQRGLEVREYDLTSINGEVPFVGILQSEGGRYLLIGEETVELAGNPGTLSQEVGALVWVTGQRTDEGLLVQSFGVIRPQ